MILAQGHIKKMRVTLGESGEAVRYQLPVDDQLLELNQYIGQELSLEYSGKINCTHCGRKTNKSFNQGHCYPCFKKLPQCDICIVSPEKCHYDAGTCRDPEWGEQFCLAEHVVYLANSSGIKVGITRATQLPTRWIDQGAIQALPIFRVATRLQSGLVETALKAFVADKTNWRTMLKGEAEIIDLEAARERLLAEAESPLAELIESYGVSHIQRVSDAEPLSINYPVLEYPKKVVSHNLDKNPLVEGRLMGIKGQYLIFDSGVINLRKYTAYHLTVSQ